MVKNVLITEDSKSVKLASKKFGKFEIDTPYLKGVICVVGYREYSHRQEVDIQFEGLIFAKVNYKSEWLNSETVKSMGKRISKVKLNRFIRRNCFFETKCRMKYFGVNLEHYGNIKKLIWK